MRLCLKNSCFEEDNINLTLLTHTHTHSRTPNNSSRAEHNRFRPKRKRSYVNVLKYRWDISIHLTHLTFRIRFFFGFFKHI